MSGDTLTAYVRERHREGAGFQAGDRVVFTLTVNPDGSWWFDLDDQLDHVAGSGDAGFELRTCCGRQYRTCPRSTSPRSSRRPTRTATPSWRDRRQVRDCDRERCSDCGKRPRFHRSPCVCNRQCHHRHRYCCGCGDANVTDGVKEMSALMSPAKLPTSLACPDRQFADGSDDFTVTGAARQLVMNENGDYIYTARSPSAAQTSSPIRSPKADGDSTTATLTIDLDSQGRSSPRWPAQCAGRGRAARPHRPACVSRELHRQRGHQ